MEVAWGTHQRSDRTRHPHTHTHTHTHTHARTYARARARTPKREHELARCACRTHTQRRSFVRPIRALHGDTKSRSERKRGIQSRQALQLRASRADIEKSTLGTSGLCCLFCVMWMKKEKLTVKMFAFFHWNMKDFWARVISCRNCYYFEHRSTRQSR